MLLFADLLIQFWTQTVRFWSFEDPSVRAAAVGIVILGISCGTLGSFVVLRRLSLLGDSLGHAVLPGVCLGFLVTWTKDPKWILAGALLSALCGSWLIGIVQRHSRLKPDVAMGLVLSGFFGLGIVLLTRLQNFPAGNQSGLNTFLFGQASAISERDLYFMGSIAAVIVSGVLLFFKELVATSFDEGFAQAAGLPVRWLYYLLMWLTALAIVISIQAVGVVLLSAMLITPAASALLLTDRIRRMVLLATGIAVVSGLAGLNLSYLRTDLPTGPFVVLTLTGVFVAVYLFSPRYGMVTRALRRRRQAERTERENVLKSIHQTIASASSSGGMLAGMGGVPLSQLAERRGEPAGHTRRLVGGLVRRGWAQTDGDVVRLTPLGESRARELERNYRLWELFLTQEVNLPYDHTQRDAENIEHILGPDLVRELEAKYLDHAR